MSYIQEVDKRSEYTVVFFSHDNLAEMRRAPIMHGFRLVMHVFGIVNFLVFQVCELGKLTGSQAKDHCGLSPLPASQIPQTCPKGPNYLYGTK